MAEEAPRKRGRPKGSRTKVNLGRQLVAANMQENMQRDPRAPRRARVFDEELTPLIVLRASMEHFYIHAAEEVREVYEAAKRAHRAAVESGDKNEIKRTASEMLATYKELKALRLDAVNVARLAAPYVHPSLSATKPPEEAEDAKPDYDPHQDHLSEIAKRYLPKEAVNG